MAPRHTARANIFGLRSWASLHHRRAVDDEILLLAGAEAEEKISGKTTRLVVMSPGTSTSLPLLEGGGVVDRNLVTGAVDEQLGAVGGESEGETGPTVEFAGCG